MIIYLNYILIAKLFQINIKFIKIKVKILAKMYFICYNEIEDFCCEHSKVFLKKFSRRYNS